VNLIELQTNCHRFHDKLLRRFQARDSKNAVFGHEFLNKFVMLKSLAGIFAGVRLCPIPGRLFCATPFSFGLSFWRRAQELELEDRHFGIADHQSVGDDTFVAEGDYILNGPSKGVVIFDHRNKLAAIE